MAKQVSGKKNSKEQKRNDGWVIAVIAIFAIAIIAMIVISKLPRGTAASPTEPATVSGVKVPTFRDANITTSGLSMGDPNAKVKVEEFADFQCPYCQLYYEQMEPGIISKYVETGKVYYTISPMAFLGQESVDALAAAYCANDQGKFWEYRDYLFNNLTGENNGSYTVDKLTAFAKSLQLDTDTFSTCLTSGQHTQDVNDANSYASKIGISSTPSLTVNGKIVDAGNLETEIEAALAK